MSIKLKNFALPSGAGLLAPIRSADVLNAAAGSRGFYSADARFATISDGDVIDALLPRDTGGSAYTATPLLASKAKLEIPAGNTYTSAKIPSVATVYQHPYSKDWGAGAFFWFIFRSVALATDQFLMRNNGLLVRILGGESILRVRYNNTTEIQIPITHGEDTLIAFGLPGGGKLRAWKNGVQLADATITEVSVTAGISYIAANNSAGALSWQGYIHDFQIFARYEPAFASSILPAIEGYAKTCYGIGA